MKEDVMKTDETEVSSPPFPTSYMCYLAKEGTSYLPRLASGKETMSDRKD